MNIGNRIKDLRKKLNLTQLELADKCGLSKNAIWNYENNKRKPSIEVLTTICNQLGVTLSDILTDSNLEIDKRNITLFTNHELSMYILELSSLRADNGIGLKKMAALLDIDPEILKKIEQDLIPNADIIFKYSEILDELIQLRKSLITNFIEFGIFDDYNSINLKDLLNLSKNQKSDFVTSVQRYIKFALEEAKKVPPSKDTINPYTESLFSKNKKETIYYDFQTVAAHNDNLTNAEIEEADRRILENINKKNNPST
ncbi:MAG: helix-turn-helix transcriptional regulator [Clostridium butyricum]|nr:helix-turn-helix transcriptional regulator [Clostridium butyricum]MDU4856437.1 helix-turn-helix transcriptional regulator [Clostridioides difficile]